MKTLSLSLVFGLFVALGCPVAARAEDEPPPLPSREEARAFLKVLLASNGGVLDLGSMKIHVSFVPDYAEYVVLRDYAKEQDDDDDEPSDADLRRELKTVGKNVGRWKGKWGVLLHCRQTGHSMSSPADFYVGEKHLAKKIVLKALGRGKIKLKTVWESKRPKALRLKIFSAASGGGRTRGVSVSNETFVLLSPDYRLDMVLKKPLKAKVRRLDLSVGRFIRFHGSGIRNEQVDLARGAQRDVIKASKVFAETNVALSLAKSLPGLARAAGFSD